MKSNNKKVLRLRWRIFLPLGVTFLILWLGTMALATQGTYASFSDNITSAYEDARRSVEYNLDFYFNDEEHPENVTNSSVINIFRGDLNTLSKGIISSLDGGMALIARVGDELIRSQITWGWGRQANDESDRQWYLTFDEGLDDQGQLELADWIIANRESSSDSYVLDPYESDGTIARVTGEEREYGSFAVQRIELIYPDGTAETIVETNLSCDQPVIKDFVRLEICSVLIPVFYSDGHDWYANISNRLESYREAWTRLDTAIAGEGPPSAGPFILMPIGIRQNSSVGLLYAWSVYCNPMPYIIKDRLPFYISSAIFAFIVLLILSATLSKKVTRPVEKLCRQVSFGERCSDVPIRELNTLSTAFNEAQDRLSGQINREREFTRAAAHELKTPITILRSHAEAAMEDISPEKRRQYLSVVLEESDRMARLTNDLLEASQLESRPMVRAPVDMNQLIKQVLSYFAVPARQKGVNISSDIQDITLIGSRTRLKEIVENLLSNALHYCPSGGSISVSLALEGGKARLAVSNDGPNIPEQDIQKIWEPFYRVDKSRNRSSGGTGLGLAIVRTAVEAHGGECGAENRPGGVTFWVLLPSA